MKSKQFSVFLPLAVVVICLLVLLVQVGTAAMVKGGSFDQSLNWTLSEEGTLTIFGSGAMKNKDSNE